MTLDTETLDRDSLALLDRLSGLSWANDFYLAGSAALWKFKLFSMSDIV